MDTPKDVMEVEDMPKEALAVVAASIPLRGHAELEEDGV